jgi:hypothetical protein
MSQAMAKQRALEAVGALEEDSDELVGIGERHAVRQGQGSVYYPYPQPFARNRGIRGGVEGERKGTSADIFLHPSTSILIIVPNLSE